MALIYFHALKDDAAVNSSERAYAARMCSELMVLTLAPNVFEELKSGNRTHPLREVLPEPSMSIDGYRSNILQSLEGAAFDTLLTSHLRLNQSFFMVEDFPVAMFNVMLNTAWVMGGDALKLYARLHGQCELHLYVEAQHRGWLADIIEEGLRTSLYREKVGWEQVMELLRNPYIEGPVVTSYSVCDSFPNLNIVKDADLTYKMVLLANKRIALPENPVEDSLDPETDLNNVTNLKHLWLALTEEERWELGMEALRSGKVAAGIELSPDWRKHWRQRFDVFQR